MKRDMWTDEERRGGGNGGEGSGCVGDSGDSVGGLRGEGEWEGKRGRDGGELIDREGGRGGVERSGVKRRGQQWGGGREDADGVAGSIDGGGSWRLNVNSYTFFTSTQRIVRDEYTERESGA